MTTLNILRAVVHTEEGSVSHKKGFEASPLNLHISVRAGVWRVALMSSQPSPSGLLFTGLLTWCLMSDHLKVAPRSGWYSISLASNMGRAPKYQTYGFSVTLSFLNNRDCVWSLPSTVSYHSSKGIGFSCFSSPRSSSPGPWSREWCVFSSGWKAAFIKVGIWAGLHACTAGDGRSKVLKPASPFFHEHLIYIHREFSGGSKLLLKYVVPGDFKQLWHFI